MHVTHATNKQKQQSNNKCSWQFVYGLKRPFKVYLGFHAPTQLHVAQHCIALNCTVNCTTHCTTHCTACCTTHHGAYLCHFYEFYWDTRYCIRTLPRGGMYWEIHPPRPNRFPEWRQCTYILSALAGKYWFCGVFFIWNLKDIPHSELVCTEWALHHPKLF